MVPSWLSSNSKKSQGTSGVEPIKSLLCSFNLNRVRLPSTLTFRDEPPGPEKSLCGIVSRISNCIDFNSNSVKEHKVQFMQHGTTKNDSQQSCDLNSRTESAIQSSSRRKKNGEEDNVIQAGKLIEQVFHSKKNNYYTPKLIETYSENCGTIYKHANLNHKSLERIKRWGGSAKSFTPKIGNISNDTCNIEFNDNRKKVVSTFWSSTNTINNFNRNGKIINSLNDQTNVIDSKQFFTTDQSGIRNSRRFVVKFQEHLENTSTQTPNSQGKEKGQPVNFPRISLVKSSKRSLLGKVAKNKLHINGKQLKEANNKNSYHRIHLSINNYFNSPNESPLISPKQSKLHEEIITKREKKISKKNTTKITTKQMFFGKTIEEIQKIGKIPIENNKTKFECRLSTKPELHNVLTAVDAKIISNKELSDNNNSDHKIIYSNSLRENSQVSEICDKSNLSNKRVVNYLRKKEVKMKHMNKRLEAVLYGERKTTAKPSKILIPQSVRGRHIFEPFADIREQSNTKIHLRKNNTINLNGKCKNSAYDTNLVWHKNGCAKSLPPKHERINQINRNLKQDLESDLNARNKYDSTNNLYNYDNELVLQSNVPVLITKPSIGTLEHSDITGVNDKSKQSLNMGDEWNNTIEENNFINRHSKSLRILKELLINTDEKYIKPEDSIELFDETVDVDKSAHFTKKSINKIESQTSHKSKTNLFLQIVPEFVEDLDISTKKDADLFSCQDNLMDTSNSNNGFSSVSTFRFNQTFVDAEVSCSFPTIVSFEKEPYNTMKIESHHLIETQTSKTSFQSVCRERKNMSSETPQNQLHSKYVNTERSILIDSATGNDFLEFKNFCCDTQLINTESTMFNDHSVLDLKVRMNSVESQVNTLNRFMNIGIQSTSTDICLGLISSLSNELISSQISLYNYRKCENIKEFPNNVIKAFEVAAERVQNLHRAIEIYRENETEKQDELEALSKETETINFLQEQEYKSQSLTIVFEQVSGLEKALQSDFKKILSHQEVRFILKTILDQVEEIIIKQRGKLEILSSEKNEKYIEPKWNSNFEKFALLPLLSTTRTKILPIVYGAVCTLVFCSLQFSTSCEFG